MRRRVTSDIPLELRHHLDVRLRLVGRDDSHRFAECLLRQRHEKPQRLENRLEVGEASCMRPLPTKRTTCPTTSQVTVRQHPYCVCGD